LTKNPIWL